jgi:hypothetical protein
MARMLNVNEVKEKKLTLRSRNALLEIVPEIGGSITRYCLKTEKQALNFLRPAIQSGLAKHDPREMASFPLIPFPIESATVISSFRGGK